MPDPERMFDELTSGDPSRVREIGEEIGSQDPVVIEALDHVTAGIGGTRWTGGLASLPAKLASKSVYVDGTVVAWRLHRAASVLDEVATAQATMETWARRGIRVWRNRDPALAPADEQELRREVCLYLGLLGLLFGMRMRAAATELTSFDTDLLDWLRNGAGKDFDLGVKYGAQRGPRVPDAAANGDDGGWTPQGLGYDPATGSFLTTSYATDPGDLKDPDDDVDASQLSVIDSHTGQLLNQVKLMGEGGAAGPKHSGGVAVNGDTVYVVGGGRLYAYDLASIRHAHPGQHVRPSSVSDVDDYSYVTVTNGKLYLGNFAENRVVEHPITASGRPDLTSPTPYDTPEGTNGFAVLPNGSFVYSVNHGRGEEGQLVVDADPYDGLDADHTLDIGNLPEELAVVDGMLVGTTESGADNYAPWDTDDRDGEGPDGVNDTGGSEGTDLADFWAQTHLFQIPLGALDGPDADGFYVDPLTLTQGAAEVYRAGAGLEAARRSLTTLHLPARVLPELDAAGALTAAVDTRLTEDRAALLDEADACDRIAGSLKDTADDYSLTDELTGEGLVALTQRLRDG